MKRTHEFAPADRYLYDCGLCSPKHGFAQVDTSQDASYFGTWANPERLLLFTYCEGDTTLTECETPEEFVSEIREMKKWNEDMGHKFHGIDPGWPGKDSTNAIEQRFTELGLGDLLY